MSCLLKLGVEDRQDKLPTIYWLTMLYIRPYKATVGSLETQALALLQIFLND